MNLCLSRKNSKLISGNELFDGSLASLLICAGLTKFTGMFMGRECL